MRLKKNNLIFPKKDKIETPNTVHSLRSIRRKLILNYKKRNLSQKIDHCINLHLIKNI
jgi:hypothetical protein